MKVLVLQLARFGDIIQTWPAINALKRENPGAEVHYLCRSTFVSCLSSFPGVDRIWELNSETVLSSILENEGQELFNISTKLKYEGYDKIYNLTYSPFSSYLTYFLDPQGIKTTGYSRFSDGHLNIIDDVSSYIYAQVGVDNSNKKHLFDLFAEVMGVHLTDADRKSSFQPFLLGLDSYSVLHLGASQEFKRYSPEKWAQVLNPLLKYRIPNLVLVGSPAERPLADEFSRHLRCGNVYDWVGKTSMQDLFGIIQGADHFIGCDSAPLQISSITGTPAFNLSFQTVNHWETGPMAKGSYVMEAATPEVTPFREVLQHLCLFLEKKYDTGEVYDSLQRTQSETWNWLEYIYHGRAPALSMVQKNRNIFEKSLESLEIILQCTQKLKNDSGDRESLSLLSIAEDGLSRTLLERKELRPWSQWLLTEKTRIAPGDILHVIEKTEAVYFKLYTIIKALPLNYLAEEGVHGNIRVEG